MTEWAGRREKSLVARSVLRISDQNAGRFPTCCVLSGVDTERAVRVRAICWDGPRWVLGIPAMGLLTGLLSGRSSMSVALPVSETVWSRWNRRNLVASAIIAFSIVLGAMSIVKQAGDLFVVGAFAFLAAMAYRTRAARNYWTTCRISRTGETIIVEPTHPDFDRQAQSLFTQTR